MQCFQCVILVHHIKALEIVVSGIMYPQDIHILISGTCEYLTLFGKGDFEDVIK